MKVIISLCLPGSVQLEVKAICDGDDFEIVSVEPSPYNELTVRVVEENLDEDARAEIMEAVRNETRSKLSG